MAVLLSLKRQKAFLRRGEWTCADSDIERRLNEATEEWFRSSHASVGAADPEQVLAAEMARRFNGRVVLRVQANHQINEKIYFSKRQLELDFGANGQ